MIKAKVILSISMMFLFSCSASEPKVLANTYTPFPLANSPENMTSVVEQPTETEQVNNSAADQKKGTMMPTPMVETSPFPTGTPDLSYQTLAVEIATRMVSRPSGTPLPSCIVSITGEEILYFEEPFFNSNQPQGKLSPGESYEILAWHPPTLYIGENGVPKGWVPIPQIGVELNGTGCVHEGPADLEDLYGLPNVCLFIAINGGSAPSVYAEPSVDSGSYFQTIVGYYFAQVDDFYGVTLSEAGPSGYVLKSSGQLVGDCP